jgi:hypothetical protein
MGRVVVIVQALYGNQVAGTSVEPPRRKELMEMEFSRTRPILTIWLNESGGLFTECGDGCISNPVDRRLATTARKKNRWDHITTEYDVYR